MGTRLAKFIMAARNKQLLKNFAKQQSQVVTAHQDANLINSENDFELLQNVQNLIEENAHRIDAKYDESNGYLQGFEKMKHNNSKGETGVRQPGFRLVKQTPVTDSQVVLPGVVSHQKDGNNSNHQRNQSVQQQSVTENHHYNFYVQDYLNDNLFSQPLQSDSSATRYQDILEKILQHKKKRDHPGEATINISAQPKKSRLLFPTEIFERVDNCEANSITLECGDNKSFDKTNPTTTNLFESNIKRLLFNDVKLICGTGIKNHRPLDAQQLLNIQREKHAKSMQRQYHKKHSLNLYQLERQRAALDGGCTQDLKLVGNQFQSSFIPEAVLSNIENRRGSNDGNEMISLMKNRRCINEYYQAKSEPARSNFISASPSFREEKREEDNEVELVGKKEFFQNEESRQPQIGILKSDKFYNQYHKNRNLGGAGGKKDSSDQTAKNKLKQYSNNSRTRLLKKTTNPTSEIEGSSKITDALTVNLNGSGALQSNTQLDNTLNEALTRKNTQKIVKPSTKKSSAGTVYQFETEEERVERMLKFQKQIKARYNDISITKNVLTKEEPYKYIVIRGNNSELIRRCLEDRNGDWQEIQSANTLFNFKWAPVSKGIRFDYLSGHGQKKMVNHLEFQDQLSEKDNLFVNMMKLCESKKRNVFQHIPVTFAIDMSQPQSFLEIEKFSSYFNILEKHKSEQNITERLSMTNKEISGHILFSSGKFKSHLKYTLCQNMFNGSNLWLLKPTDYNRGRGVQVFNSLDQFKRLIMDYQQGVEVKFNHQCINDKTSSKNCNEASANLNISVQNQKKVLPKVQNYQDSAQAPSSEQQLSNFTNLENVPNMVKTNAFVIQKYLERPLLIQRRKFDIRLWVLMTHEGKYMFFKEGYIRTSSYEFTSSPESIDKPFIHLTNNAVQQFNDKYGAFEEGNQLSFTSARQILASDGIDCDFHAILQGPIQDIIRDTMASVDGKLNPNNRKYCMEIFGYDFILDEDLNPWLIEVNTNPCLEESSTLLKVLIPRMLDDALKLTLDVVFPPKKQQKHQGREFEDTKLNTVLERAIGNNNEETKPFSLTLKALTAEQLATTAETQTSISVGKTPNGQQRLSGAISQSCEDPPPAIIHERRPQKYPVPGYLDQENMWNLII